MTDDIFPERFDSDIGASTNDDQKSTYAKPPADAGRKSLSDSSTGEQIVSGSSYRTVRLWDVTTCATIRLLPGHFFAIVFVYFSSDGTRVASTAGIDELRVCDERCVFVRRSVRTDEIWASFSPNANHAASFYPLPSWILNMGGSKAPGGELILRVPPEFQRNPVYGPGNKIILRGP